MAAWRHRYVDDGPGPDLTDADLVHEESVPSEPISKLLWSSNPYDSYPAIPVGGLTQSPAGASSDRSDA